MSSFSVFGEAIGKGLVGQCPYCPQMGLGTPLNVIDDIANEIKIGDVYDDAELSTAERAEGCAPRESMLKRPSSRAVWGSDFPEVCPRISSSYFNSPPSMMRFNRRRFRPGAVRATVRSAKCGRLAHAYDRADKRCDKEGESILVEAARRTLERFGRCQDARPASRCWRGSRERSVRLRLVYLVLHTRFVSIQDRQRRILQIGLQTWPCGYYKPSRALACARVSSRPLSRSASPETTARMNARSSSADS